jgi:hypothetical protein
MRLFLAIVVGLIPVTATSVAGGDATRDPCSGHPATVAAQQESFAELPGLGTGWVTADGYVPVALPDRRTAWLMSDTVVAALTSRSAAPGANFVHNSIVVQRGTCFTAVMGGTAQERDDLIPDIDGRACWPSTGVARDRLLVVVCTDVENAEGPPGFGFRVVGTSLAVFALPGLTFVARSPLPFTDPAAIRWGTGAVRRGRWVYVYGTSTGPGTGMQYAARVRFDELARGPWRFWTGRTWGARDALAPMTFVGATPAMPAFVTPRRDGYVAVAFSGPLPDPTIAAWTASAPQGPWRPRGTVGTATTEAGQYAYDARAVDLGRAGWAIVYNVNDPVTVTTDPMLYGGRFVRAPRRLQGATKR